MDGKAEGTLYDSSQGTGTQGTKITVHGKNARVFGKTEKVFVPSKKENTTQKETEKD